MEFSTWQKELLVLLCEKGISREDVYSVMLVLSRQELGEKMISWLKENPAADPEAIFQKAGTLAFGPRS
ncbi:MAG: hypothetical protein IKD18_05815 [Clostridia bacterium]|nr:hypothetical protein [Clostridia bacterium]